MAISGSLGPWAPAVRVFGSNTGRTVGSGPPGIALYPNPDVDAVITDYVARITANGGTISAASLAAIAAFVAGCRADGIWHRIDWLNPFAGNQLAAARVALKVGSGNSVFPLLAWVSGDYTEAGGLVSGATTKYVDTGVLSAGPTGGIGFYLRTLLSTAATRRPMGSLPVPTYLMSQSSGAGTYTGTYGSPGTISPAVAGQIPLGLNILDRTAPSELYWYANGVQTGSGTTTATDLNTNTFTSWIFGGNNSGVISGHSPCTMGLGITTLSMTAAQNALLYTRIQTLMTAFGRNV